MPTTSDERSARDYTLVPAQSIDGARLREFATVVWPDRSPDPSQPSWWQRADPSCAVAAVHKATGGMAGICLGRPAEWTIGGAPVAGVAICGWYVAPGHHGRGLGKRLVEALAAEDRFLYAFSISQAAIVNFQRLGWVGPWRSTLLALPLPWLGKMALSWLARPAGLLLRDYVVANGALPEELGAALDAIEAGRTPLPHMRRDGKHYARRLADTSDRAYHFCVAYRSDRPVGFVALRRGRPDGSRLLGKLAAALIVDLAAVGDRPEVLRALARRAVAIAGDLRAGAVLAAATDAQHARALRASGFLSSTLPVLGRPLATAAPQYMWSPKGPGAHLRADEIALTFADSDLDLNL